MCPCPPPGDDADVRLLVDGTVMRATAVDGEILRFALDQDPRWVRIDSRSAVPAETGASSDLRRLGVHVTGLALAAPGVLVEVEASHAALVLGWHGAEGVARWTDGAAIIPPGLFDWIEQPFELRVNLPRTGLRYPALPYRALLLDEDDGVASLLRQCGFEVTRFAPQHLPDLQERYLPQQGSMLDLVVLPPADDLGLDPAMLLRDAPNALVLGGAQSGRYVPSVATARQTEVPDAETRSGIAWLVDGRRGAEGLRTFAGQVMPFTRFLIPGIQLHAYGGRELVSVSADGLLVGGQPDAAASVLDRHRMLVVPQVAGGAGVRELVAGLACGIPVVTSPDLAQQLGLAHECQLLVAEDATEFAMSIARLDGDRALWRALSGAGRAWAQAHVSPQRARRRLHELLVELERPDLVDTEP